MIKLHFISPSNVVVPVKKRALFVTERVLGFNEVYVVTTEGNRYHIGHDSSVSYNHLRIYLDPRTGKYYIQDLGSTYGTKVNGALIPGWKEGQPSMSIELTAGSVVEVGSGTVFMVEEVPDEK